MKKLIAIDGSTTKTGVAIFRLTKKQLLSHTVITPENIIKPLTKKEKASLSKTQLQLREKENKRINIDYRTHKMIKELSDIFKKHKPDVIIMEDTYGNKDMYAYKKLCQLQGLVLSYCIEHDIEFILKPPQSWRKDLGFKISENGKQLTREDYKQMSTGYIKDKYNIEVTDDEADAICIGESYFTKKK